MWSFHVQILSDYIVITTVIVDVQNCRDIVVASLSYRRRIDVASSSHRRRIVVTWLSNRHKGGFGANRAYDMS